MNIFTALLLLVLGFVLLIKGADYFVDGASSVAKKFRIPSIIIGFTIVAMGTSLPECAVSVTASLANNNALAISNVVGSNIFNLMVVCGASAIFAPLAIQKSTLLKEFPFSILFDISIFIVLGFSDIAIGIMLGSSLFVISYAISIASSIIFDISILLCL